MVRLIPRELMLPDGSVIPGAELALDWKNGRQ